MSAEKNSNDKSKTLPEGQDSKIAHEGKESEVPPEDGKVSHVDVF